MDENFFDDEELNKQAKRSTYASTEGQVGDRERRETSTAGPLKAAKNRVVSKKELEESGLSLREFLNRERGLKKRQPKTEMVPRTDSSGTYEEVKIPKKSKRGDFGVSERDETSGVGMKKGGTVSSASKRGDGIAIRGKTKGRIM